MTMNHLPGNCDLAAMGQPVFSETSYEGIGCGLGFSVVVDPAAANVLDSPGEYAWAVPPAPTSGSIQRRT